MHVIILGELSDTIELADKLFTSLYLCCVSGSTRHSLHNGLEPPILFSKVASSLCPGAFPLQFFPKCPQAPCVQQYLSVNRLLPLKLSEI